MNTIWTSTAAVLGFVVISTGYMTGYVTCHFGGQPPVCRDVAWRAPCIYVAPREPGVIYERAIASRRYEP